MHVPIEGVVLGIILGMVMWVVPNELGRQVAISNGKRAGHRLPFDRTWPTFLIVYPLTLLVGGIVLYAMYGWPPIIFPVEALAGIFSRESRYTVNALFIGGPCIVSLLVSYLVTRVYVFWRGNFEARARCGDYRD
ncbi:MAG: hypothetical protein V1685_02400 [Parcubacteria group bacterium]